MYCIICSKYRNVKNFENIFTKKTLVLSIIAVSVAVKLKRYLKKKNKLKYVKFLVWTKLYNYFENIEKENISLDFRVKQMGNEKLFFEKVKHDELISKIL